MAAGHFRRLNHPVLVGIQSRPDHPSLLAREGVRVAIPADALAAIRAQVAAALPDFPVERIVVSATHTHTAPVLVEGLYEIPDGVMTPTEYVEFFAERVADAIRTAWESRRPCMIGYGMAHAVVAANRRTVYADNSAVM